MTALAWVDTYRSNPERSEWDAGCLVTRVVAEDCDADQLTHGLADLKRLSRMAADSTPASLCEFVAGLGFAGDATIFDAVDASRLDRMLATRRGIPITLAVLYVELGRAAGLSMHGIGFPGHFLVRTEGVLLDPFANTLIGPEQWPRWLELHGLTEHAGVELTPATPDEIALRMFNNAKRALFGRTDNAAATAAFDLIDCQLALGAEPVSLHLERAELWRRLGSVAGVRAALTDARQATRDQSLVAALDERLSAIARTPEPPAH